MACKSDFIQHQLVMKKELPIRLYLSRKIDKISKLYAIKKGSSYERYYLSWRFRHKALSADYGHFEVAASHL